MTNISFLLFSVNVTECNTIADSGHYAHDVIVSDELMSTPQHSSVYIGHGVTQVPKQFVDQAGVYLVFSGVCPADHLLVTFNWFAFAAAVTETP